MAARSVNMMCTNSVDDERRRGKRMPLRCEARLVRKAGEMFPVATENLSSSGFYCHARERLIPGEEFDCYILLSSDYAPSPNRRLVLACRGRVVRVESLSTDLYGVGCQIDDYLLIPE